MCCRYFLLKDHLKEIYRRLGLEAPPERVSRYNIAPGEFLPAVRLGPAGGRPEAAALRWGFIPSWARAGRDAAPLPNARSETMSEKPTFRDAFRSRRCLIPASGYYEWEARGRERRSWLFRRPGHEPFCLAGLWESWRTPDGSPLETCAVVTTAPNGLMQPIHHRMPVTLGPEEFLRWLDPGTGRPEDLAALLRTPPDDTLTAARVTARVNRVGEDDPGCLEPPGPDESAGGASQLDLSLG